MHHGKNFVWNSFLEAWILTFTPILQEFCTSKMTNKLRVCGGKDCTMIMLIGVDFILSQRQTFKWLLIIVSHSMPMGSKIQANNSFIETCLYSGPQCSSLTFFLMNCIHYLLLHGISQNWLKGTQKAKMKKKKLEIRYGITWKLSKESEAHKIHFPFGNGVACRVGLKTLNSTVNTKVWMTQLQKSIGEETVKKEKRNHAEPSLKTPKTQKKEKRKKKRYRY